MIDYIKFWLAKEFAELIIVLAIVFGVGGLFCVCSVWASIASRRHKRRFDEAMRKKKQNEKG